MSDINNMRLRRLFQDAGMQPETSRLLASAIEIGSERFVKRALDKHHDDLHAEEIKAAEEARQTEERELDELAELDRQVSAAMSDPMHSAIEPMSQKEKREALARIRAQEDIQLSAEALADMRETAAKAMCPPGDDWKDLI